MRALRGQITQSNSFQSLTHNSFNLRYRQIKIFRPESDIFSYRLPNNLTVGILKNQSNFTSRFGNVLCYRFSVDKHLALGRNKQAVQMANKDCFAGAVRSGNNHKFASMNLQTDIPNSSCPIGENMG